MGRVFLADRADGQFEQRVALKLVRSGQHGGEVLAPLPPRAPDSRPARNTPTSRVCSTAASPATAGPYFAMEYVEGEPITTYCDERSLDVERAGCALFALGL